MLPQFWLSDDRGLVDGRPGGTGSRRRRSASADGETTATLLVSGCAPPMPSIWRGSGLPMIAQQQVVALGGVGRQVVGQEVGALGGAAAHQHAAHAVVVVRAPLGTGAASGPAPRRVSRRSPRPTRTARRACRAAAAARTGPGPARPRGRLSRGVFASFGRARRGRLDRRPGRQRGARRPRRRRRRRSTSPGADTLAAEDDGHVDRAGGGLDRALRGHGRGPDGEAHRAQFGDVAHAGVDDQAADAAACSAVANSSPNIPSVRGEVVVTTRMSPAPHCSTAAWIIRLSPGQHSTVTAVPAIRAPGWIGRGLRAERGRCGPCASCTVATPKPASASTSAASAPSAGW